jgi:hypothetical protein
MKTGQLNFLKMIASCGSKDTKCRVQLIELYGIQGIADSLNDITTSPFVEEPDFEPGVIAKVIDKSLEKAIKKSCGVGGNFFTCRILAIYIGVKASYAYFLKIFLIPYERHISVLEYIEWCLNTLLTVNQSITQYCRHTPSISPEDYYKSLNSHKNQDFSEFKDNLVSMRKVADVLVEVDALILADMLSNMSTMEQQLDGCLTLLKKPQTSIDTVALGAISGRLSRLYFAGFKQGGGLNNSLSALYKHSQDWSKWKNRAPSILIDEKDLMDECNRLTTKLKDVISTVDKLRKPSGK